MEGKTEGIKFKSKASEKQASSLNFSERQAEAILAMQLSKLIGLEILKLHDEQASLMTSVEKYRKILGSDKELFKVIKTRLREYKKLYHSPRRTQITSVNTKDYVEEIKIEDIYILIDRFGYTKSIDNASYSRISEDNLKEYSYIIQMKNTDNLCIFTAEGYMHQVKAENIPKCKIKDRGTLIHTLCKIENQNIILYTSFEMLFESQLLFTTKLGYIKQVSGAEFETNRSQIISTKLVDNDEIININMLSARDILSGDIKVIILTDNGLSLGFPLSEVSELKKSSRGVKAITLAKDDYVAFVTTVKPDEETFIYQDKVLNARKVRNRKRGDKGHKAQLE
jgi:DNA gyrase subunit A